MGNLPDVRFAPEAAGPERSFLFASIASKNFAVGYEVKKTGRSAPTREKALKKAGESSTKISRFGARKASCRIRPHMSLTGKSKFCPPAPVDRAALRSHRERSRGESARPRLGGLMGA